MSIVLALLLATTSFKDGAPVPRSMVAVRCGGSNVSPALTWSNAPAGTRSFALVVHDPDAGGRGGFYHWVAYNIPPTQRMLPQGRGGFGAGMDGKNDTGAIGYFGPCPPPGKTHHYHFTLYALNVRHIDAPLPLTAREVQPLLRGHILAQAELIGTWSEQARQRSASPRRRNHYSTWTKYE